MKSNTDLVIKTFLNYSQKFHTLPKIDRIAVSCYSVSMLLIFIIFILYHFILAKSPIFYICFCFYYIFLHSQGNVIKKFVFLVYKRPCRVRCFVPLIILLFSYRTCSPSNSLDKFSHCKLQNLFNVSITSCVQANKVFHRLFVEPF